ncbi:hypothetical protein LLEC1_03839 [Akanthomyces lecanii]|uniref:Deoxyribonuclease NucA/NucB domain-containing protein n=1 Tax=Cordyceps confragosa TaxID=2714763 RepID=A0A179IK00_CORDF|nr:hypothetical protein LLEC1_03839 [Akanthomyces lecanii]
MRFQFSTLSFAGLVCLSSLAGHVQATPPDLSFLCDKMPEVCTNMCWAVRCASPTFPQTLTFDFPTDKTKDARRTKAGCNPHGNKCGTKNSGPGHRGPPNTSCDEYPFASVKEADGGPQVSRCVPGPENSRQGQALSTLQKKWKKEGKTRFLIGFGNPGSTGVRYCNNEPCTADGFEVQDGKVAKRDAQQPMFRYYRTRAGMVLASIDKVDFPSNFTRMQHEADVVDGGFELWTEVDEEFGELRYVEDTVMEELSWDHFLK